jgi:hypothetical protein
MADENRGHRGIVVIGNRKILRGIGSRAPRTATACENDAGGLEEKVTNGTLISLLHWYYYVGFSGKRKHFFNQTALF